MSDQIARFLASTPLFAEFETADLERLAQAMRPVHLEAGQLLVSQGDPASSLFIIMSGRLRAYVRTELGAERAVGEIGAREIVGEMSLLSSAPRSATVRAVRDTHLLELEAETFTNLVLEHPRSLLEVTRLLVTRLERSIHGRAIGGGLHAIAVVPGGSGSDHREVGTRLAAELRSAGSVEVVDARAVETRFGPEIADLAPTDPGAVDVTEWLHRMELETDHLLLIADEADSTWTRRCVREADRILLVGRAGSGLSPNAAEKTIGASVSAQIDLALIQPDWISVPSATSDWTRSRSVSRVHHVRSGDQAGIRRLARVLAGRSVGLVLSGGGARGFAHIGVLQALREAEIPIDHVGGASFGAVVAGAIGMGWDSQKMSADLVSVTGARGSLIDVTAPAIAIARGRKLTQGIRGGFGDVDIEDLWIDFFCVSADLTGGKLRVHEAGPVWKALRASVAIPGTFPPVRGADGHVLADGGIMDNLPLDVMHARDAPGVTLGVDLRAGIALPSADLSDSGVASGWRVLGRRLNPWAEPLEVPHLMDILLRVTEIASGEKPQFADIMFRPPVEAFKILDFKAYPEIIEVGYRHAVEVLERSPIKL